jgi:hypothetical protein
MADIELPVLQERFDRLFRSEGGRYKTFPATLTPFDNIAFPEGGWACISGVSPTWSPAIERLHTKRALAWIEYFQKHPRQRSSAPPVYFDYVNSAEFNAAATTEGDVDFIAINASVVPFLYALFGRLLCFRAVYPSLGDVTKENSEGLKLIPGPLVSFQGMFPEGRSVGPEDPTRSFAAFTLTRHAFDFLILHELGHLRQGHCALSRLNGRPKLVELVNKDAVEADLTTDQCLEMDADAFATNALIDHVVSMAAASYEEPFGKEMFADLERSLGYWLFAIFSMWHCFVPDEWIDVDRLHSFTHPPARLRQTIILRNVDAVLRDRGHHGIAEKLSEIARAAVQNVEVGFSNLTGDNQHSAAGAYAATPAAAKHISRILAQWKHLYPVLEPLARYSGLAPKPK